MTKPLFFHLCLILLSSKALAQQADLEFRGVIGVVYHINKSNNIKFYYRLDIDENITAFKRSNFSFALEKKLNKWLETELYYRFITNYEQDEHRFRFALITDRKIIKKTKLQLRTMLQHDIAYFDGDYLRKYQPEWIWRNRLLVQRSINKRLTAKLYCEPFAMLCHQGISLYRLRSGSSLSYERKKWQLSAEYFYQTEFFDTQSKVHMIGFGATHDITRAIRPKKKRK